MKFVLLLERMRAAVGISSAVVLVTALWLISLASSWLQMIAFVAVAGASTATLVFAIGDAKRRHGAPTDTQLQQPVPAILEIQREVNGSEEQEFTRSDDATPSASFKRIPDGAA